MSSASVIIVGTRDDYIVDHLVALLGSDPRIRLAVPNSVSVRQAMVELDRQQDIRAVVLVCLEVEADETVTTLRRPHPWLNMAVLTIGAELVHVTLPNPGTEEIRAIVSALLNAQDNAGAAGNSGHVLKFPLRPAQGSTGPRWTGRPQDTVDPCIMAPLRYAMEWADTATRALLALWNPDSEGAPGLTLSWEGLRSWLERIHAAVMPWGEAERAFQHFVDSVLQVDARHTPLARIVRQLDGERLALKLLLAVLAPELDVRFHRMLGVLQDDLTRRHCSVGIACAVVAGATRNAKPIDVRVALAGLQRLRTIGLIEGVDGAWPASDAALRVHPTVLDWIMSGKIERLFAAQSVAALLVREADAGLRFLPPSRREQVAAALHGADPSCTAILLTGSHPGWLPTEASALAGEHLHVRPVAQVDGEAVATLVRMASLAEQRLLVDLSSGEDGAKALWRALAPLLSVDARSVLVVAPEPALLLAMAATAAEPAVLRLPPPTTADLRAAVELVLATQEYPKPAELASELANRYVLPLTRMPNALAFALSSAAVSGHNIPDADDWKVGFRSAASAKLPALARRVEPVRCPDPANGQTCLDHVVLPQPQKQQLLAILDHVRFGREVLDDWGFGKRLGAQGVAALFSGASGTGKTLAAYAIASALAADMYLVDLARVTSKYIGETEKNLDAVFGEAEQASAVLLFDEAESLFSKRSAVKDAHDRYANIEVAYLLQRLEAFPGLAILTSNYPENIDPAFTRRLRFSVEFPQPDVSARRAIWEQLIPKGPHRDDALDLAFLARRLELTGGNIRQLALHAAIAAARDGGVIRQQHVHDAARTVLLQLGAFADLGVLSERAA